MAASTAVRGRWAWRWTYARRLVVLVVLAVAAVAVAYLLGTLPVALAVARRRGIDPTAAGSGNPGATNVLRTAGRTAGALTLAGDVAKGALAAGLGWAAGGQDLAVLCGAAAVVGHVAPVTRGFRGGKGVATGAGMAFVCVPVPALAAAATFAAVAAATRRASLASMTGTVAIPVAAAVGGAPAPQVAALAACAALVVARHRDNIARLVSGTEPRIGEAIGEGRAGRPGRRRPRAGPAG